MVSTLCHFMVIFQIKKLPYKKLLIFHQRSCELVTIYSKVQKFYNIIAALMCKTPITWKLFSDHSNGNLNFISYDKAIQWILLFVLIYVAAVSKYLH